MNFSKISAVIMLSVLSLMAQINRDGLVAWYPFDGDYRDYSGNRFDLRVTYPNSPSYTIPTFDENRKNIDSSCVTINNATKQHQTLRSDYAPYMPSGNSPRTIAFWLRGVAYPFTCAFFTGSKDSGKSFYMGFKYGGKIHVGISYKDTTSMIPLPSNDPFNNYYFDGVTWRHFAFTFENDSLTLYLNGGKINKIYLPLNTGNSNFLVGSQDSISGTYSGSYDDLVVYNRALSPSEVMELKEAESFLKNPTDINNISVKNIKINISDKNESSFDILGRRLTSNKLQYNGLYVLNKIKYIKMM